MLLNNMGAGDVYFIRYACHDTASAQVNSTIHCGEVYSLGKNNYSATGVYTLALPTVSGCDSVITLDLTVIPLDKPVISVNHFELSTAAGYASYQWFRNDTAIQGLPIIHTQYH